MKLTTTVYKYKRTAPWMIGLMALGTVFFFFFSVLLHPLVNAIGIGLLMFLAAVAALRPRSIFSVRSVDERKLVFTPDALIWGTLRMPIHELSKLEIYIHAFNTFKHRSGAVAGRRTYITEYGDKNTITFIYQDVRDDLTFYLDTFEHYDTLVKILQSWRNDAVAFSVRSAFADSFIREQVKLHR